MLIGLLRFAGIVSLIPSGIVLVIAALALAGGVATGNAGYGLLTAAGGVAIALLVGIGGLLLLAVARHLEQQDSLFRHFAAIAPYPAAAPRPAAPPARKGCPKCSAAVEAWRMTCPNCSYEFPPPKPIMPDRG